MARPIWSGTISFGLVNVPVKAYTRRPGPRRPLPPAREELGSPDPQQEGVGEDRQRGRQRRHRAWATSWRKGRYVVVRPDELDDLRRTRPGRSTSATSSSSTTIDPIYYERTYWLAPDGDQARGAYRLLLAAMEERGRVGIGTVVMRNKQYLAAIRPLDGALAMSTMRFADEVVPRVGGRRAAAAAQARRQGAEAGHPDHRRAGRRLGPDALPRHLHRGAARRASRPRPRARRSSRSERPNRPAQGRST